MPRTPESDALTTTDSDDAGGRVWSQTTIKINLGNYESMEVSIGSSMPCRPTSASRKSAHRRIHTEHMAMLSTRVEEARSIWTNS